MRPSSGKRVLGYLVALVWGSSMVWSCSADERDYGDEPSEAGAGGDGTSVAGSGGDSPLGGESSLQGGAGATSGGAANGGEGGAAVPSELTVLSISPTDGATDVERVPMIEVVFSTDIDAASVTSTSFSLLGPAGKVAGTLDVVGGTVTFEPDLPLSLLGKYTLELSTAIHSTVGEALNAPLDTAFHVRDGAFGAPKRIWSGAPLNLDVVGSDAGHVGVSWAVGPQPRSFVVAIFDPATATWSEATEAETDTQNDYTFGSLGVNTRGEAFAQMGGTANALWNRFDGAVWGFAQTKGVAQSRSVALADDGTAMTVWYDPAASYGTVYAASQSRAGTWAASTPIDTDARTWAIERYGSGFLALTDRQASDAVYARVFEPGTGWLVAKPVTSANANANWISLATTAGGALFTWADASNMAMASVFDGSTWAAETLGPILGGTKAAASPAALLAAWISSASTYAAIYRGADWGDPVKLGPTNAEYGIGAEVDDLGNALVAWPNGSDLSWRRLAGGAWSAIDQLSDQDPGIVFSEKGPSGDVMLVWSNPLGIWAARFE
jgi:hypothetical protein